MGKFYAVYKGKKCGVYTTWNDCRVQVHGFKGSVFRSFSTKKEADVFARTGKCEVSVTAASKATSLQKNGISSVGNETKLENLNEKTLMGIFGDIISEDLTEPCKVTKKRRIKENNVEPHCDAKIPKKSGCNSNSACTNINGVLFSIDIQGNPVVYTDGACSGNGKKYGAVKAGYGVWWGDDHPWNISRKLEGIQTNQRAEIAAINACIKQAVDNNLKEITIRTDSMFVINCVTKWVKSWLRNNWTKSDGKPVIHKNEFLTMLPNLEKVKVHWEHVRGHKGIYGNEMADKLAVYGASL